MSYRVDFYKAPPIGKIEFCGRGYRLCYCQRGRLLHLLDGDSATLTHGDVFLLPEDKLPELEVSVKETYFYVITFTDQLLIGERDDVAVVKNLLRSLSDEKCKAPKFVLPPEEIVFFESVLSRISSTNVSEGSSASASLSILSLLASISELFSKDRLPHLSEKFGKESFIRYCVLYVDAHCTESITIDDITKLATTSRAQFCKLFKRETGLSFSDYLNRKRIQRAMALIKCGEKITDVSYMCGYSEFTTFYRNFIKFTSSSPSKYRDFITTQM